MSASNGDTQDGGKGYSFGTFAGVFTPSILTIIGVIMYLRFGWVVGNIGLLPSLFMVTFCSMITFVTGLAISALATNMRVEAGGAYFMVSRSLGVEAGGAIGLPLYFSQAVSVAFYCSGFAEALASALTVWAGVDIPVRYLSLGAVILLGAVSAKSAKLVIKAQYLIMLLIVLSLISLFAGGEPPPETLKRAADGAARAGFWTVLAVFFPAVTGILSGVGMSGDLKNPRKSLPLGTLAAVVTGWAVYMSVTVALRVFIKDDAVLRGDMAVFTKCARVGILVSLGVWAATLSSALGCLLSAPRTLQALARDRVVPRFFGKGFGKTNDPVIAAAVTLAIAVCCVFAGDIDAIAPVLTMINLTTYCLLNLSAAMENFMGNPAWRPTFHVHYSILFAGAGVCAGVMLMIGPGQAMIAFAIVVSIYWLMKRRAMKARWGDIRDGMAAAVVRLGLRRLSKSGGEAAVRNWRPNLLVFSGVPSKRKSLLSLAGAVSQNRSFMTAAAIVPQGTIDAAGRAGELRSAIDAALAKSGIESNVVVEQADDLWQGCRGLVKNYGFGPLVPNTVMMGLPRRDGQEKEVAALAMLCAARRRNLMLVAEGVTLNAMPDRIIDVWWRGRMRNGSFMLAIAWLLLNHEDWEGCRIRLCRIAQKDENADAIKEQVAQYLDEARVSAEVLVLPDNGSSALSRIPDVSSRSALVILGLRMPGVDDTADDYAKTIAGLRSIATVCHRTVLALAAEDVDFGNIFKG